MNSSSNNFSESSSLRNRDSPTSAAVKNVIVLTLGLIISYINGTLILTFRKHQVFYMNPRYILFIHLVVNDMIQLTTAVSLFVISYVFYYINASVCCFILVFAIFTTQNTPLNLAAMAVECYIAVCFPLRHAELCTVRRTYILIVWIWVLSSVSFMPDIFLTLATEPQWLFFSSIYCYRDTLFRHPVSLKKRDVSFIVYLAGVWFTLFFTYFRIFFAAQAANSADGKAKKARNTILLHGFQLMLCMLVYVAPMVQAYFTLAYPQYSAHFIYVWFIIVQILTRLISPIVYGLRDKTFKEHFKKYLLCTIRAGNKMHPSVRLTIFAHLLL